MSPLSGSARGRLHALAPLFALALPLLSGPPAVAAAPAASADLRPVARCGDEAPYLHHRPLPGPAPTTGEPVRRGPARLCR
ncbi:hypothetical protein ACGFX4_04730 [Kitasatospora sp. NPDC048365]|uniref:hypothetical protein n=1 Tax=Kitasatospora sp. NPDC048365 TaxID=3364050 RepID=UPI00371F3C45